MLGNDDDDEDEDDEDEDDDCRELLSGNEDEESVDKLDDDVNEDSADNFLSPDISVVTLFWSLWPKRTVLYVPVASVVTK